MLLHLKKEKIFVPGGTGFLGKRIIKKLEQKKLRYVTTSQTLGVDLRNKNKLESFFEKNKPTVIMNCAAYVGGINFGLKHEAEIFYNNILISTNLIECARKYNIKRFINPISNCSYPNVTKKDFKESEWWDGPLHPTVLVYGFVRKAVWVQSQAYHNQYGMDFVNLLIPNMYGPEDHFDEVRSHALGALIMKIVNAKEKNIPTVSIWGTGKPVREWLYIDDCVEIFIRSLKISPVQEPINIGQGKGISIANLANLIKNVVDYKGKLLFDRTKPDGAPYKKMNVDRMKKIFRWHPLTELSDGITKTVKWYYKHKILNDKKRRTHKK